MLVLSCFFAVALSATGPARALTAPISGAVAYPASGPKLLAPVAAGYKMRVSSGYSPTGGSSLHADTNNCCKANDYYALDIVYDGQTNGGKGLPIVAPIPGKVIRAGWATSGWANYGLRVILEHDLGDGHVYHSLYAHLDTVTVTEGATVTAGQKLGTLGQSCMGALSCSSFSAPHLHFALHRDSSVGGSGTGGSYGGNAVVPEPMNGVENLTKGVVFTSTNSGQAPSCGDGFCNGTETSATCPGDCPTCKSVPPTGRIVDDSEGLCFQQAGSPTYWHKEAAGHLSTLYWTYGTADAAPDNTASWVLVFDEAGDYQVEAFVTSTYAQSKQAKYTVAHGTQKSSVVLDQSAAGGWRDLGTFTFAKGGSQSVRLDDNSGEAVTLKRQIVFDAIRFTRVTGSGGTGGTGAGGTPATGGSAGSVGGEAGSTSSGGASGSGGGWSGGGGGLSSGGGSPGGSSAGGTEAAEDSGCGCRIAGERKDVAWPLLALAGWLFLARRRRR